MGTSGETLPQSDGSVQSLGWANARWAPPGGARSHDRSDQQQSFDARFRRGEKRSVVCMGTTPVEAAPAYSEAGSAQGRSKRRATGRS